MADHLDLVARSYPHFLVIDGNDSVYRFAGYERDGFAVTDYVQPSAEALETLFGTLVAHGGIATCPFTGTHMYIRPERVTFLRWIGSLQEEQEIAVATEARLLLLQPSDDGARVFAPSAF